MHSAIFITVRTGSTRLPRKALLDIAGVPTIVYLIRRLKTCRRVKRVILCTTDLPEDQVLVDLAKREGIAFFQGSVEDKLARWRGAAHAFGVDFFITADGDDLLCDPELIDQAFAQIEDDTPDFLEAPGLACGAFTYGIKVSALDKVCEIKDTNDTEMMWVYFKETGLFRLALLKGVDPVFEHAEARLTLDYQEDLDFFRKVIDHFEAQGAPYGLRQILPWLRANPEVVQINAHLQAVFLANQKKKTHLKIKNG